MENFNTDGLITREYVNTLIRKRKSDLHKGGAGHILIAAGSMGMAGAAILCVRAALRTGSGLVTAAVPEELIPILQVGAPEAMCISRMEGKLDLPRYNAAAAGPGLGDDEKNVHLIRRILKEYEGVFVLDADGLNLAARLQMCRELRQAKPALIITPHPGEAGRLLGISAAAINADRQGAAGELAQKTGAVTVLKGAGTVVATPKGITYINTTGNPGMATGGSGDVLTGMIASLAGQGLSPLDAAKAGVFLHGMAGDKAASALGEYGLIASDIALMAALAIKEVCNI